MRFVLPVLLSFLFPLTALANGFEQVRDEGEFLDVIEGKELRIGLYNLTLKVTPDGKISGKALGWNITGDWQWRDGFFCRQMDWEGKEIEYNCQLVEKRGAQELRFTSNRGAGQSASFRLR